MLDITFFLCDQMLTTSVSLPLEQLHAAQTMAQTTAQTANLDSNAKKARSPRTKLFNARLASIDKKPIASQTGLPITPDCNILDIEKTDLIYLPALWRNPRPILKKNTKILDWLRQAHKQGSIIAGVGTGCYFMAEAGLLDHKPATTHWFYFDDFQRNYPKAQLKRQHFITEADKLYCTGSVNSMADLTIHFIQRFFSPAIASHVERHFFHEIRKAYDSENVFRKQIQAHPDEDIIQIQLWLQENYGAKIKFTELAEKFEMSTRTLNRRFKNAAGITPVEYVQKIRIDTAKELVQTTNLSIGEVMFKTGYHDHSHFLRLFKKYHGITPSQYRTTVRAKLFNLE